MRMKIRLKMKKISHRNDLNRPGPRSGHKYTKWKMCLVYFLVNINKSNMGSEKPD